MDTRTHAAMTLRAFEDVRNFTRSLAISSPCFEQQIELLEVEILNNLAVIADLREENQHLKAIQNMTFADGVLWLDDRACCPECGINHNKEIVLNESIHQSGMYFCPECFNSFYTGVTAVAVST